jgi:dolichol-phosphate mannosyltransferase
LHRPARWSIPVVVIVPPALRLLSVVIPARDEEGSIKATLESLCATLRDRRIPFEIVVIDDGSTDQTWSILESMRPGKPELRPVQNTGNHGYGCAVIRGLDEMRGDAAVIMMADQSDDPEDVVRYWEQLNAGHDCVFGSRFVRGSKVIDYPRVKWFLNRLGNYFIQLLFRIRLNDTTNAFKAYRREAIEGMQPLISPHFNLTVEMPLKAVVRGYTYAVVPIRWTNRATGISKLKLKEMGSRYLFIVLYIWLEKMLARGDYHRRRQAREPARPNHV